jgi:hypothetical protein
MLLRLGESVFGRDDLSMAFVSREAVFVVYSPSRYTAGMGERWCTVTMIEESGRRHSVDVLASSTFDAAHIFLTHAKAYPRNGIPRLSLDSVFEVVVGGKFIGSRVEPCNRGFSGRGRNAKAHAEFCFHDVRRLMIFDANDSARRNRKLNR